MHLFYGCEIAFQMVVGTRAYSAQVVSEERSWGEKLVHEEPKDSKEKNKSNNEKRHP